MFKVLLIEIAVILLISPILSRLCYVWFRWGKRKITQPDGKGFYPLMLTIAIIGMAWIMVASFPGRQYPWPSSAWFMAPILLGMVIYYAAIFGKYIFGKQFAPSLADRNLKEAWKESQKK